MANFSVGGDWTWRGNTVFSGGNLQVISPDIQMEGSIARFDCTFGGTQCSIADSNAPILSVGNINCFITFISSDILMTASSGNVISSSIGITTFGNSSIATGIYGLSLDVFAQGGSASFQSDTNLQIGGGLTPTINIGNNAACLIVNLCASNATLTIGTPTVHFPVLASANPSGLSNLMLDLSGNLVVSNVINP